MRRQTDKKRKDRWTDASHPFYECQRLPLLLFSLSNVRCASDSLFIGRVFRRDPISSKREGPSRSFRATHHCSRSFRKSIERRKRVRAFRPTAPLHRPQSATNTSGSVWFLESTFIVAAIPKNLLQFARQTLKTSIKQLVIQTKQKDALSSLVFL